jgi:phage shock protein A
VDEPWSLFAQIAASSLRATVPGMEEPDRDKAVEEHLEALDDEIARLRRMEAAMDRRIAEAEAERRAIEEATRQPPPEAPDPPRE